MKPPASCPDCESPHILPEGSCWTCGDCGLSACGGGGFR